MILFLLAVAGIWGLGSWAGLPRGLKRALTILVFAAILLAHGLLPPTHPLPRLFGGNLAGWATLAGAVALVWLYLQGLGWLRSRARDPDLAPAPARSSGPMPDVAPTPVPAASLGPGPETSPGPLSAALPGPAPEAPFSVRELDRYARHIVLREIGGPGQKALKQARVLVVGAGGLGSPALLYLAAAGVGTIGVIDDDVVSNSNLQRQVIHRDADIGTPKVFSAEAAMRAQNPHIAVRPYHHRLTEESAAELFAEYDLILEGSDNFDTRYLVNRVAAGLGIPVIGGAISQWEGQLSVWDPGAGAPCYECVFPTRPAEGLAPSCAEAGVIGPLPGTIGAMMASEAIKILAETGDPLRGRMFLFDGLFADARVIRTKRREDCPVCGASVRDHSENGSE